MIRLLIPFLIIGYVISKLLFYPILYITVIVASIYYVLVKREPVKIVKIEARNILDSYW